MPVKNKKQVDNFMNEQQNHLQNLLQQRQDLQNDIESTGNLLQSKRELFFKVQGAIEYLTQTGVTLPEVEQTTEEPTEEG